MESIKVLHLLNEHRAEIEKQLGYLVNMAKRLKLSIPTWEFSEVYDHEFSMEIGFNDGEGHDIEEEVYIEKCFDATLHIAETLKIDGSWIFACAIDHRAKVMIHHFFNVIGYAYKSSGMESVNEVKEHPSFGMIGVSRRSSSGVSPLFGSNIQHQHTFTLTIKTAENNRHLNTDWFHAKKQLIEVELSGAQFLEMMTSLNMGDGIPCTIRQFNGNNYPDPPYENPLDTFQKEFDITMKNLGKECQSIVEDCIKLLKEKSSISKADRDFILGGINKLMMEITSNVPFVNQQFNKSVEKTVSQAKTEIETFLNHRMLSLGIDAAKTNPELFLGTKIDNENKNIEEN